MWTQGKLVDKVYAASPRGKPPTAAHETTLINLYVTLTHFRGIIVPPGYVNELEFTDGNPYGVSRITGPDNKALVNDSTTAALDHLVQRVVAVAARIASEH